MLRRLSLTTALTLALSASAFAQSRRPNAGAATLSMRPAIMYSCMTMPSDGPPMVDATVPRAVAMQSPGYGIVRYNDELAPSGWSLWRIVGRARRDGQSERISHVVGFDGTNVVQGARLFIALGIDPRNPWLLARRALAVLFSRAEERPLRTADNATVSDTVRGRVADPVVRDGHLLFWARTEPGTPYAHEVDVDLADGHVVSGNVF